MEEGTVTNDISNEFPDMHRQEELAMLLGRCGRFAGSRAVWARGQGSVLKALYEKDGVSQKELALTLGIKEGSLSELLRKLEKRGSITRGRCPDDRRRLVIRLTDQGRAEYEAFDPDRDIFEELTDEEKEKLIFLLRKLAVSWIPMMRSDSVGEES